MLRDIPLTGPSNAAVAENMPDAVTLELSRLALVRTTCSSERSVLSWMRTYVSMYSFGFSISKFADFLQQSDQAMVAGLHRLGLVIILLAILGLTFSLVEHIRRVRTMRRLGLPDTAPSWLPATAAVVLLSAGLVTMIGIAVG
jgi:putative membrane protein